MTECRLCPRNCGVDRAVELGFCRAGNLPYVSRIMLHHLEEPFISGVNGSGAVFFSGCNLGCVFCQNEAIRDGRIGKPYDATALADAFLSLQLQGAHNINLVTAAPHVPLVASALRLAKGNGLGIPVVYNSGGYESVEALRLLDGLVDVYLPDLKYVSPILSKRFSFAEDYFAVASAALDEMARQVGVLTLSPATDDSPPLAVHGMLIRHLVLPCCVDDSRRVLEHIVTRFSPDAWVSVMRQFTPNQHVTEPPLNRRVTDREYDRVLSYALTLGLHNILIQEKDSADAKFTPVFT